METYLLIHEGYRTAGLVAREGSQIRLAGVDEINLGECLTLDDVRRALRETGMDRMDLDMRVSWPGAWHLLTSEDLAE